MARIRSVHPKLWTDEDFVSLPAQTRLFLIGLWGEADDYGLFEWKPLGLKMRLAPVDAIDVADVLLQLEAARFIVRIERGGRALGVVRNFRKWQRPKNPSAPIVPIDGEIADVIALPFDRTETENESSASSISPALPQPYPSPSVIAPQMEDGGDKMEDGVVCDEGADAISSKPNSARKPLPDDWPDVPALKVLVETINSPWLDPSKSGGLQMPGEIGQWRMNRCSWTEDVLPVVAAMVSKAKKSIGSWSYFTRAIYENRDTRLKAGPAPPTVQAPRRSDEERQAIGVLEDFRRWDGDGFPWPRGDFPDRATILEILKTHGDADDLARFHLEFGAATQAKKQLETGELVAEL